MLEWIVLNDFALVVASLGGAFYPFFGLSALAVEAYGFTLVRPFVRSFVRDAISGDPRIRFF